MPSGRIFEYSRVLPSVSATPFWLPSDAGRPVPATGTPPFWYRPAGGKPGLPFRLPQLIFTDVTLWPVRSWKKQRFFAMPRIENLGSLSWYCVHHEPGVSFAVAPLSRNPLIGKKLSSVVSIRALFQRFGSHTAPGCPGPLVPFPPVPYAPLFAI